MCATHPIVTPLFLGIKPNPVAVFYAADSKKSESHEEDIEPEFPDRRLHAG